MKRKTIIKRAASSFIAAFMAAGVLSVPFMVSAQEAVKLTVTSLKGEPGKDIVVSVTVSADSGIGAMDFVLKYDNSKLLYKSYMTGTAAQGGMLSLNPNYKTQDNANALKQAFIHPDGLTAAGSILDVTFTIAPGWTGSTKVTLEVVGDIAQATSPYNKIPYSALDGTVNVDAASGGNTSTSAVETNEAGETVSTQSVNGDTTANSDTSTAVNAETDDANSTEKASSQKMQIIFLSVCGVLVVGAAAAFVILKKK